VIQRGNRRQKVFFHEKDKEAYLSILKLQARLFDLEVWAYCLMDNHVHLIVVPKTADGLVKGIGETHRLYTRMINFREEWNGYLWQGRFKSIPLDEQYTYTAIRYVERNPVRAGLVRKAGEYPWSSARWHIAGDDHPILSRFYLLDEIGDWERYLEEEESPEDRQTIRKHSEIGRPLGHNRFIDRLEIESGRILHKRKSGPKRQG